jgi:anti-sigma B factor antagonist
MEFETTVEHYGAACVVTLKGELDVYYAPNLREELNAMNNVAPLILDLSALTFLDSSGIGVLVALNRQTEHVRLVRGPERIQRVFEITGLMRVLHFYDSVEVALETPLSK